MQYCGLPHSQAKVELAKAVVAARGEGEALVRPELAAANARLAELEKLLPRVQVREKLIRALLTRAKLTRTSPPPLQLPLRLRWTQKSPAQRPPRVSGMRRERI